MTKKPKKITNTKVELNTKLNDVTNHIEHIVNKARLDSRSLIYVFRTIVRNQVKSEKSNGARDYFTLEETDVIEKVANQIGLRYGLLIGILLKSGIRINELQAFKLEDIDKERSIFLIKNIYSNNERKIPVDNSLIQQIFSYTHPRTTGYIFINEETGEISHQPRIKKWIQKVSIKSGFIIYPAKLRKTYFYNLIEKGTKKEDILSFMGCGKDVMNHYFKIMS